MVPILTGVLCIVLAFSGIEYLPQKFSAMALGVLVAFAILGIMLVWAGIKLIAKEF
jgi:hypothetical protein